MGEICPQTKSYPPLIKQKLISTPPPPHNDNIKASPPPLEKSLLPLIPSYLVYLLDFFLRYKHHFKWLFDVCWRVIWRWRVIRITGLWACVVFAWIGRFLIFYSISGTKVFACVGGKLNLIIPCFKFVLLLKFQQLYFKIMLNYDAMCTNIGIFLIHWITL